MDEGLRLAAICLFAVVGAIFLLLLQVGREAAVGYEVQQLQQTKASLEQKTYLLESEMASLQSLDRIEKDARTRLKMQPASRYLFVTIDEPSLEGTAQPVIGEGSRPWWGTVLSALGRWQ